MNFDYRVFKIINDFAGQNAILDKIGVFFAEYLPYIIGVGALIFAICWFVKNKSWKVLWQAPAAVILSRGVITEAIRFLWHRPRPFVGHTVNLLINHEASGSFPSGHTTFLFALAVIIYFWNKKLGWLFFVLSFLACLARIFVGVHYPADILAGMAIGIFSGWLIYKISKKFSQA